MLRHLFALTICGAGSAGVLALMVWMNSYAPTPEKAPPKAATAIKVAPPKPKAKKRAPKPKPKPKRARKARSPRTPPPALAAGLSGIDLGMGGIQTGAVGGLSDGLIGDPGKNLVMTEDAVDSRPKTRRCPRPKYPQSARAKGVKGYVKMRLLIGSSGQVERVRVVDSVPPGVFDQVAKDAVQRCGFDPASYQGKPVKVWAVKTVNFKLSQGGIGG